MWNVAEDIGGTRCARPRARARAGTDTQTRTRRLAHEPALATPASRIDRSERTLRQAGKGRARSATTLCNASLATRDAANRGSGALPACGLNGWLGVARRSVIRPPQGTAAGVMALTQGLACASVHIARDDVASVALWGPRVALCPPPSGHETIFKFPNPLLTKDKPQRQGRATGRPGGRQGRGRTPPRPTCGPTPPPTRALGIRAGGGSGCRQNEALAGQPRPVGPLSAADVPQLGALVHGGGGRSTQVGRLRHSAGRARRHPQARANATQRCHPCHTQDAPCAGGLALRATAARPLVWRPRRARDLAAQRAHSDTWDGGSGSVDGHHQMGGFGAAGGWNIDRE